MTDDDRNPNPYQPPHTGSPTWFQWKRVPHGIYRAYLGYVDQMQKDGGTLVGHLVCWAGILFFGLLLLGLSLRLLQSFFPILIQYLR